MLKSVPTVPDPLTQLRRRVTHLDHQLIRLLAKRRQLALQIGRYKLQHSLPLHDPLREQQLLQAIISAGEQQQLESDYIAHLFQVILQHSLAIQKLL